MRVSARALRILPIALSIALSACGPISHAKWPNLSAANFSANSNPAILQKDPTALRRPSPEMQKKLVLRFKDEMLRLDGEGLIARIGRPVAFADTANALADATSHNRDALDFYRTFTRLNATYTNLHSRAVFAPSLARVVRTAEHRYPSIWLMTEVDSSGQSTVRVDALDNADLKLKVSEGDEVVAINGSPISDWLAENFLFCKHPLRIQCDRTFEQSLHQQILSWKSGPLTYTVTHDGHLVDLPVSFSEEPMSQPSTPRPKYEKCDDRADKRYPGFTLTHKGHLACLFEKDGDPTTAVLRIQGFQYRNADPKDPIRSVTGEVNALYPYWVANASRYSTLIIDLIDNHGGSEPIPYYEILFQKPFQEQYVRFKKIKEFDDEKTRKTGLFWDDPSQELLFQKRFASGEWQKLKEGEFTEPSPMFCADSQTPCDEKLFTPRFHPFRGKVKVMVNEFCVSSCDGFAWAMKNALDATFYGFPQASDAAYARLRIDAIADEHAPDGFRLETHAISDDLPKGFIVGQIVAVSRTVNADGTPFNGHPIALDHFVPYRFGEYYPKAVFESALK